MCRAEKVRQRKEQENKERKTETGKQGEGVGGKRERHWKLEKGRREKEDLPSLHVALAFI